MNRVRKTRASLTLLVGAWALCQCAEAPRLRNQIAGLQQILEQAERNGARRCAPRELAVARSQLEFAGLELDQGFVSKAQAHLSKAASNARAAESLSPPRYCGTQIVVSPAFGDRDREAVRGSGTDVPPP